jgi:RsiW-degrading membrane proteinase PrsW (M82 family)
MNQNVWAPPPQQVRRRSWGWLSTFFIGLLLFIATTIVMFLTGNPNLYPTVILIGNFLVPVVFVVFLYDHQHLSDLAPETIGRSFGIGGILGVLGASILESLLLSPSPNNQGLSLGNAVLVGLIEEGCKLAAVAFLARHMRARSPINGLLLGAAVGMGFAALESTGYAFTAFLSSQGHVGSSLAATVLRGLFAPFGHGIWTAIVSTVLFRQSGPRHFRFNIPVILTYLSVSLLHGFWDGLPFVISLAIIIPPGIPVSVVTIILGLLGVVILTIMYRNALRQRTLQPPTPNIESLIT